MRRSYARPTNAAGRLPRGFDPATDHVPLRGETASAPVGRPRGVRILLPLRDVAEWSQARPFLVELAAAFRVNDPVRVAIGLDGALGVQEALGILRELLLASNVPMEETLTVDVDIVHDMTTWRDAGTNNVRLAVIRARRELAELPVADDVAAVRCIVEGTDRVRTHRVFPALQPWSWRVDSLRELVRVENLAALRIEPVTRGREPAVLADLHFCSGEHAVTIPMVYVDLAQLDLRETDPLVFPHAVLGVVTEAHAGAIVERVFPDLERRAVSGGFWHEEVFRYGDMALFERARSRGFFGASPLAIALPRIAAGGLRAALRVQQGRRSPTVRRRSSARRFSATSRARSSLPAGDADADARAWYGDFAAPDERTSFDLAVGSGPPTVTAGRVVRTDPGADGLRVGVAEPLPADVMLAFNAADGNAAATFSVSGTREPFVRPVPDVDLGPPVGRFGRPDRYRGAARRRKRARFRYGRRPPRWLGRCGGKGSRSRS